MSKIFSFETEIVQYQTYFVEISLILNYNAWITTLPMRVRTHAHQVFEIHDLEKLKLRLSLLEGSTHIFVTFTRQADQQCNGRWKELPKSHIAWC